MPYEPCFDRDLELGEVEEAFVEQMLLTNGRYTIEVKSDFQCHNTGNFFVEVYSHGRPAGLSMRDVLKDAIDLYSAYVEESPDAHQ